MEGMPTPARNTSRQISEDDDVDRTYTPTVERNSFLS